MSNAINIPIELQAQPDDNQRTRQIKNDLFIVYMKTFKRTSGINRLQGPFFRYILFVKKVSSSIFLQKKSTIRSSHGTYLSRAWT